MSKSKFIILFIAIATFWSTGFAKIKITDFAVGINTASESEIWFEFTLSDSILPFPSSDFAEDIGYIGQLHEATTDSVIASCAASHHATAVSFKMQDLSREVVNWIYDGDLVTYILPTSDMPLMLADSTIDTIAATEFKTASMGKVLLTDKQQSELNAAVAGKPSIINNDFSFFREVDEEDSTKAEYVAQFVYMYPGILGLKNFHMRARGRLSSEPGNPLNYGELSLFYNSQTVDFEVAKKEFILSGYVEAALYGNQKMDTLSGEFRLGARGLIPNLIDLTAGFNRLRLKPVFELGVAGAFHSHELPLYKNRKDHMEAFFGIYYYIPVADKFAIVYDAQGNVADFADEDIKFTNSVSFNYDLPLKDLQTLVKWESGQNKFSYETDQRVLIGIVYNYLPDNAKK